jgi:hypothetical protein
MDPLQGCSQAWWQGLKCAGWCWWYCLLRMLAALDTAAAAAPAAVLPSVQLQLRVHFATLLLHAAALEQQQTWVQHLPELLQGCLQDWWQGLRCAGWCWWYCLL